MLNALRKQFYDFRKFGQVTELWAYFLANVLDAGKKRRFLIFSQGRTGSTLLVKLLNQHPEIYCDNELLQKSLKQFEQYFEGRALMTTKPVYGFNVHPYQIMDFLNHTNSRSFVKTLLNKGWKIIYLRRDNIFRHALSNEIAKKRGYFFRSEADFEQAPKVYINPDDFKQSLAARFKFRRDEEDALEDLSFKEVIYERDMLKDHQKRKTMAEVYRYLGVDPAFKPQIPFIRSTHDDLSDIVDNIEEISKIGREANLRIQ